MNRIAIAALETKTIILAADYLSNHFHLVVRTADKGAFMHYLRMSLTYYFNKTYNSIGNVGTRNYGCGKIIDPEEDDGEDLKDAICYVLRNPIWHSIQNDFRSYKWSTFKLYFKTPVKEKEIDPLLVKRYLPGGVDLPKKYMMLENGLISLYCYTDVKFVEELFGSYRHFNGQTNIPSRRELDASEKKKKEEGRGIVVNRKEVLSARKKETETRDLEISEYLVKHLEKEGKTIPLLSFKEKVSIANQIRTKFYSVSCRKMARILLVPEATLRRHLR